MYWTRYLQPYIYRSILVFLGGGGNHFWCRVVLLEGNLLQRIKSELVCSEIQCLEMPCFLHHLSMCAFCTLVDLLSALGCGCVHMPVLGCFIRL